MKSTSTCTCSFGKEHSLSDTLFSGIRDSISKLKGLKYFLSGGKDDSVLTSSKLQEILDNADMARAVKNLKVEQGVDGSLKN